MPGEHRQLVPGLLQLLVQGRQRALELGQGGILGIDVRLCDGAQIQLATQHISRLPLQRDDAFGALDLGAQARLLDGRGHHVGRQREIRGIKLVSASLRLSRQRFDRSAIGAEHVGHIRDRHLGSE